MADRPSIKQCWELVKSAASSWIDDYAPSMGAALSYYTVFSLGPLLLIVISIAGLVFGDEAARGEIFGQLNDLLTVATASEPEASYRAVKSGDTLSKIAQEAYGNANAYMKIFEANKPMLTHPDKIYPGQMLRIPPA